MELLPCGHVSPGVKPLERTVILTGPLWAGNGTRIINRLNNYAAESDDDIQMIINSPGGRVDQMIGIIDTMNLIKPDVKTIVFGGAASAAAAIAVSGAKGKRYVARNAETMFHMPRGGWQATKAGLEYAEGMMELMEKILAQGTGKTLEQVQDDIRLELFMNAGESLQYGVYDHILA